MRGLGYAGANIWFKDLVAKLKLAEVKPTGRSSKFSTCKQVSICQLHSHRRGSTAYLLLLSSSFSIVACSSFYYFNTRKINLQINRNNSKPCYGKVDSPHDMSVWIWLAALAEVINSLWRLRFLKGQGSVTMCTNSLLCVDIDPLIFWKYSSREIQLHCLLIFPTSPFTLKLKGKLV